MAKEVNKFSRKDVEVLEWIYEEFEDRYIPEDKLEALEKILDKITEMVSEED